MVALKPHLNDLHSLPRRDLDAYLRLVYTSTKYKKNASDYIQCIAAGLLLPGSSGLKDPVEKETINVLDCLELQEAEDITASAQHALREGL